MDEAALIKVIILNFSFPNGKDLHSSRNRAWAVHTG